MKVTIAIYEWTKYSMPMVVDLDLKESRDSDPEYVRLTEWVEVDLPEADSKQVTQQMVAAIDEQIKEEMASSQMRITGLEQRKAELLALPNLEVVA